MLSLTKTQGIVYHFELMRFYLAVVRMLQFAPGIPLTEALKVSKHYFDGSYVGTTTKHWQWKYSHHSRQVINTNFQYHTLFSTDQYITKVYSSHMPIMLTVNLRAFYASNIFLFWTKSFSLIIISSSTFLCKLFFWHQQFHRPEHSVRVFCSNNPYSPFFHKIYQLQAGEQVIYENLLTFIQFKGIV